MANDMRRYEKIIILIKDVISGMNSIDINKRNEAVENLEIVEQLPGIE